MVKKLTGALNLYVHDIKPRTATEQVSGGFLWGGGEYKLEPLVF